MGTRIGLREWAAAAWFGPRGFASVVYGLLALESGVELSNEMFHLIALSLPRRSWSTPRPTWLCPASFGKPTSKRSGKPEAF